MQTPPSSNNLDSPVIRSHIRKSVGNSEPPNNSHLTSSSSLSPSTFGKYLPTAESIARGRLASISLSPEARRQSSRSPSDDARRKSSLSPSAEARRKSSLRVNLDDGGESILGRDNVRLAARLGECNFIEIRTQKVQNQVDSLSLLMQGHVAYQQRQDIAAVRTVRFGDQEEDI